jgi:quinoprotein glucose dehydrogenase
MRKKAGMALAILSGLTLSAQAASDSDKTTEWVSYGRDPGGMRFSPDSAITRQNVSGLQVAWTFRTGELQRYDGNSAGKKAAFEATPLMVAGTVYFSTPSGRVFALDPATGKEKWQYDPKIDLEQHFSEITSRGVSIWIDRSTKDAKHSKIFIGTIDGRLICLNAASGEPCHEFGKDGAVDLRQGVGLEKQGEYQVTSPPAVIGDLVVVGSAIGDNRAVKEASGVVRAYDVHSGELKWSWDPIPRQPGEPGFETWNSGKGNQSGAANVWSIISADADRDLIFVPTTSPSPDYYGGERLGDNLYANSVVALRASTGKPVWHFQAVHHDLWDYDIAMEPALITVQSGGTPVPAVAFATKVGHIFVLNRENGKPIFPVEERPVPQTDVPGEQTSPTQPFPVNLPLFGLRKLSAEDAWGVNDADREYARKWISSLRYDGVFTPISTKGSVEAPSNVGGMNWGGMAFDPERQILVTPTNRIAAVVTLIPRQDAPNGGRDSGMRLEAEVAQQRGTPYILKREYLLKSGENGVVPYTSPPWGTLAAVNLKSGKLAWEVPLGHMLDPAKFKDAESWGSLSLGGPIATAGGVVFIAATVDANFRAFDIDTGKLLWKMPLPAAAQATPMTYTWKGKQYVLICAGGHGKLGTKQGDYVVAYSLPGK